MTQTDLGTVVIVDDNPNNLEVLEGILVDAGYKVRPALTGALALRAMELNPPDLVLLDIRMPDMDGYETCRRVKKNPLLCDVPIIFVSALSDTEDKVRAFEVGGVDYVSKPFQREEVLARVRTHVQLRRMQVHLETLVEQRTAELREAYDALSAREREFRTLAENQPDLIVRYDKEGRKSYFNNAMAQVFGVHAVSYVGLRYDQAPVGDDRSLCSLEYVQAVQRALSQGTSSNFQMVSPGPTGELRHFNIRTVAERDDNGQIKGALAVARDITQVVEAESRLQELSDQLRQLAARQEEIREDERRHIAREIHDELGQQLTALRLKVNIIKLQYAASPESALRNACADLLLMVDRTIQVARNVSTALRPAALDIGIAAALDWLAAEFQQNSGVKCEVEPIGNLKLAEDRAVVLFRIAQESLTNVARHAQAHHVRISLNETDTSQVLEIQDDGIGFDAALVPPRKFGLLGMRERALAVGGKVSVESSPGKGTRVRVAVPIKDPEAAPA